jgi:hypothetical protein
VNSIASRSISLESFWERSILTLLGDLASRPCSVGTLNHGSIRQGTTGASRLLQGRVVAEARLGAHVIAVAVNCMRRVDGGDRRRGNRATWRAVAVGVIVCLVLVRPPSNRVGLTGLTIAEAEALEGAGARAQLIRSTRRSNAADTAIHCHA